MVLRVKSFVWSQTRKEDSLKRGNFLSWFVTKLN